MKLVADEVFSVKLNYKNDGKMMGNILDNNKDARILMIDDDVKFYQRTKKILASV